MFARLPLALFLLSAASSVQAHISFFHPSMWGFNIVSDHDPAFNYDNRPVAPLFGMTFKQWWFHNHLDFPPAKGEFFELPAGGTSTAEVACVKSATSFGDAASGGDIRRPDNPNDPCPGSPSSEWHTVDKTDTMGCGLAIAYESDVNAVQPEDFTIFSVNQTCVWTRFTEFKVPERMPACPPGGCICSWFWIHSPDSGGEQNYMNGFRCNVTGAISEVPLAKPEVPRRCGKTKVSGVINTNPASIHHDPVPGNCTHGAKQPFYWFQKERNNMFEGNFAPPEYTDLYNFRDGAQDDIFVDSYDYPLPAPSPNQTVVPRFFANGGGKRQDNGQSESTSTIATATASKTASGTVKATSTAIEISTRTSTSIEVETATSTSIAVEIETATSTSIKLVTITAVVVASPTNTNFPVDPSDPLKGLSLSLSIFATDGIASPSVATTDIPTITPITTPTPSASVDASASQSVATGAAIAAGAGANLLVANVKTHVPAAAALADALGNDEALNLNLSVLAADDVPADTDSDWKDIPIIDSNSSSTDSGASSDSSSTPGQTTGQACKRSLVSSPVRRQQQRKRLFSFHATKQFNRRKLIDKRSLWSMW